MAVAQWVDQSDTPAALALPIVRVNGCARVATLDFQWPLPGTELVR